MPCRLRIALADGQILVQEKRDYEGFLTRPMGWDHVARKFQELSKHAAEASLRRDILAAVANLEAISVNDLTRLLAQVHATESSTNEGANHGQICDAVR
jgi:2-methylcitrate dehydratase